MCLKFTQVIFVHERYETIFHEITTNILKNVSSCYKGYTVVLHRTEVKFLKTSNEHLHYLLIRLKHFANKVHTIKTTKHKI